MERKWSSVRTMHYSAGTYDLSLPTAMFDFDSTLRPFRGRGPSELLSLTFLTGLAESFNIVIISNRSSRKPDAMSSIHNYVHELDHRLGDTSTTVYAPTARDRERKPHTGTWEHFVETLCAGVRPKFAFYCGDAAGRPGDHSGCDYMYALNVGIDFITPEALFFGASDPWVDPVSLGCSSGVLSTATPEDIAAVDIAWNALGSLPPKAVVFMCGSPGSGKSRIALRLADSGCTVISRDVLGTRYRYEDAYLAALKKRETDKNPRPIILDSTNPQETNRYCPHFEGAIYFVCHVSTPKEMCFHLNAARCQLTGRAEVPPVGIHKWWKCFEPPTVGEQCHTTPPAHISEVITMPFVMANDAPPEVVSFCYPQR